MKKKKIDFVNIIINLILLSLITILLLFIYYCVNYGLNLDITELADNLQITKIETSQNITNIAVLEKPNNLYSPEVYNNQTSEETVQGIKTNYYYEQIDGNAKIIYNALKNNTDNLKTGNYEIEFGNTFNELLNTEGGSDILNNSYQQALDAFLLDNPDIFYIDVSKMILMIYSRRTILKTTYNVSIKSEENTTYFSNEFTSKEQIDIAYSQLENMKNDIISGLTGDTFNKVKQVHDYLINNLEYDETISKNNIRNIYGGLVTKEVVCEGYAKSFKYILDDLGIPNVIVVGTATNSNNQTESHAWNYVYINEKWYAVDVTWDDPIVVGGGKLPQKEKYKYFLKGSEKFNINHTATGIVSDAGMKFSYPELNLQDF